MFPRTAAGRGRRRAPLTPEKQALAAAHVRLALGALNRLRLPRWRRAESRDDLQSDALLALVEAAADYDPAAGGFESFAWFRVTREVCRGLRRLVARECRRRLPLDLRARVHPDPLVSAEAVGAVTLALLSLPGHYALAVRLVRLEGLGTAEAAARMGCSPQTCHRRVSRGLARLRYQLRRVLA